MPIMAKKGGSGDFQPVSEGLHPAVCWAVVDLGIQRKTGQFAGEAHEVYLGFEVLDQSIEFEKDGQKVVGPMRTGITITNSLHEKSKLRRFAEKWRGRPFTEAELGGFDVAKLAGHACQVLVTHTTKGDKTYANIENILAWPKDKPKPPTPESLLVYELDNPTAWDRVPNWLQTKISNRLADNWDEFNRKDAPPEMTPDRHSHEDSNGGGFDDDIPFLPCEYRSVA